MSELPSGWSKKTISDVVTKPKQNKPEDDEIIKYVDIGSINREKKFIENPQSLVGSEAPSRARKRINKDDVLVSLTRPNLNAVAIVPAELDGQYASTGFDVLKPVGIHPRFLFYLVRTRTFIDAISGKVQGALYPAAKSSDVQSFEFFAPEEDEQKRIADKLDNVLAKVEAAQARLDKIPAVLKRFRQSVLAAATSGELTKDWRLVNDKNEDWDSVFLKEISSSIRSGSGKKPTDECEGVPMLRSSAVRVLEVDYDDFRTISETLLSERDYISNDDLLFTRLSGSKEYVGNCSKVTGIKNKIAFPDRLFKVELKNKKLASFIEIYCSSPNYFKYIEASIKSSAGHQRITTEVIKNIVIRLPTETEQNLIVSKVNELFERADGIQKQYDTARIRLAKLTQSILAKAFKGELLSSSVDSDIKSIENSVEALNA